MRHPRARSRASRVVIGVVAGMLIVALLILWYVAQVAGDAGKIATLGSWTRSTSSLLRRAPGSSSAFDAPTPAQALGWPAIASGEHTLIQAPTGSGKTLAAFLYGIDRLTAEGAGAGAAAALRLAAQGAQLRHRAQPARAARRPRVGPARRRPHRRHAAARARADAPRAPGHPDHDARVALPAAHVAGARDAPRRPDDHRRRGARGRGDEARRAPGAEPRAARPAHRQSDPAHRPLGDAAPARGDRPLRRRRPADPARRRGRRRSSSTSRSSSRSRTCASPARARSSRACPAASGEGRGTSIWPSIYPEILRLVREHRSTIVFVNNRRLAERLALRLNELAEEEIARAHHGSIAREQRVEIEELLKRGAIPCLVATSSLELGIDMGAVDLVIQVESPKSVARGLQRIGRAGHSLGEVSTRAHLPEVPRRPARGGGDRAADAARARSRRRSSRGTRSTCSRSRSSRSAPRTRSPSTSCTSSSAARTRSPTFRGRSSTTCSTCSRAAIRPTSSRSCGRASSGTARPA